MRINKLKKWAVLPLSIVGLWSCDSDFNTVGSDMVGQNHYDITGYRDASVVAYNQDLGAVQTNNLEVNPLGVLTNTPFGKTTAHFVTQVELSSQDFNFTLGNNIQIERVVLQVPYYSTLTGTDENNMNFYRLDSIVGNKESRFKMNIYENGFYLRDLDPNANLTEAQRYFSDQKVDFENFKKGSDGSGNSVANGSRLNNSSDVNQNDAFYFNPREIVERTTDSEGEETISFRAAPAMYLDLDKEYFKRKILSQNGANASVNNNTFRNYFRGLYFQIESLPGQEGALAMMNFKNGTIKISYTQDPEEGSTERVSKSMTLTLTGTTVSLLENERTEAFNQALTTSVPGVNSEKLYVHGGAGSLSVIELFGEDSDGNGIADELETLRDTNWMVNEANLVFHIDQQTMLTASNEPLRIYLYDLKNNIPLVDYTLDQSNNSLLPKYGKLVHGGILEKDATIGRGVQYKLKLTNHIANLIKNDSTNVKLGLVVTEDVRITSSKYRKLQNEEVKKVPTASVMNQLGTILYGNHANTPEDKRLRLEIFFTKPN